MRIDARTRPGWTLVGAGAGLFLLMLDSTVVARQSPAGRRRKSSGITIITAASTSRRSAEAPIWAFA